ncbi:hypothetical protein J2Y69_002555 [Microbacterium resistens]|uniref:DUF4097 domain-containing protein n=1 Tax=Microbacterium resistens TaxID=156977 RepID=A0ABU1SEF2_9MICO|nr:DUF4097 family beta strand repeat-containing protein [Microbacterium resistens]MDR6867947.1 hypothetical protein [Microbacterium resistens]
MSRGRGITIAAAIVGGLALLGTGGGAAFAATGQFVDGATGHGTALDGAGLKDLDLESGGADVEVRFGDVDKATLEVTGSDRGRWEMRRDDDTLVVRGPEPAFGWWISGWFHNEVTVTLTLPTRLDGKLDAELDVASGSLSARGDFRELDLGLGAGSLAVDGSAQSVKASINAGRADLTLSDVRTAELSASAGRLEAGFSGRQPDDLVLEMSAGSMDVTVPRGTYSVQDQVSAGSFDNQLETASASSHTVSVTVSAGSLSLRPGS